MPRTYLSCWVGAVLTVGVVAYDVDTGTNAESARTHQHVGADSFVGSKAGDRRKVAGIKLRWCPPGRFRMGSSPNELQRLPDEGQVDVTLTKGFWMGEYEVTQGQWKRVVGRLPGELTTGGGKGKRLPVYNVNYAEAERFCRKLTENGPPIWSPARGLGVPAAHRGPVGVRLPRRHHHCNCVR